ncbi:MAG: hypothetical protein AAB402_05330 [Patescibacteria group bacterium]
MTAREILGGTGRLALAETMVAMLKLSLRGNHPVGFDHRNNLVVLCADE